MTPKERRGKWLFLILASLIVIEKLFGVGLTLAGDWDKIKWLRSVVGPICFCVGLTALWDGEYRFRWFMGGSIALIGSLQIFVIARILLKLSDLVTQDTLDLFMRVAGYPLGLVMAVGLFYLVAGLLLLFSPSIRAFFRYQREGDISSVEPYIINDSVETDKRDLP